MTYYEIQGDLFEVDEKYYFCQCISSDFIVGKGIEVEFDKRYNMRDELSANYKRFGKHPACLRVKDVFNLVVKVRYYHKPTYKALKEALEEMKKQIMELDVKYLAMPRLCSGSDKLNWYKVSEMVKEVFEDVDIRILVVRR